MTGRTPLPTDSSPLKQYLISEESKKRKEDLNLLFWKEQLLDSPQMKSTSKRGNVSAEKYVYELSAEALVNLQEYCKANQCSLFNMLTAAQIIIMSVFGKTNDLLISLVISNRFTPEEQNLMLNMVMLLHVRFKTIDGESPSAFLLRIRDETMEAFVHRHYDYSSLYRVLDAEARKREGHPAFPAECNLIIDKDPILFPNILFKSRRDDDINNATHIHSGGFLVYAFETGNSLKAHFLWDKSTWNISGNEMSTYLPELFLKWIN
jgi:hypothetical protein